MSVPPGPSNSDKRLEKIFAVILGIFALAVVLMMAFVIYTCVTTAHQKSTSWYYRQQHLSIVGESPATEPMLARATLNDRTMRKTIPLYCIG